MAYLGWEIKEIYLLPWRYHHHHTSCIFLFETSRESFSKIIFFLIFLPPCNYINLTAFLSCLWHQHVMMFVRWYSVVSIHFSRFLIFFIALFVNFLLKPNSFPFVVVNTRINFSFVERTRFFNVVEKELSENLRRKTELCRPTATRKSIASVIPEVESWTWTEANWMRLNSYGIIITRFDITWR